MKLPFRHEDKGTEAPEQKNDFWPLETPPPPDWFTSGIFPISAEQAIGLPALLAVIRLLSHAAGMVPLLVLRGADSDLRERARDTWQWKLLHRRPGPPPMTPFSLKMDIAAQFAGRGNAYVRKLGPSFAAAGRPRVAELVPLNAAKVKPKRDAGGSVVFEDRSATDGHPVDRRTDEVIHVRSFNVDSSLEGIAPITAARMMVMAGLRRQEFETKHLTNGIFPGLALKAPTGTTREDAERWIEFIESRHQGSQRAGKLIAVGGGFDLEQIPVSLEDALFAEMTKLTIAQAANIYQIPQSFFVGERVGIPDSDWRYFITFALGPMMQAMAESFSADDSLFPPDEEDDLFVETAPEAILRMDPEKQANMYRLQRQGGWKTANEIRAEQNLAPRDGGDELQVTPVGGAPNPDSAPADDGGHGSAANPSDPLAN